MNGHARIERELYDYLRGDLLPRERSRVERHLEACARCRGTHEAMASMLAALSPPAAPPADSRTSDFWPQLVRSIEEEVGRQRRRPPRSVWPRASAFRGFFNVRRAALALSAAAATAVVLLLHQAGSPPAPVIEPPAMASEARADGPELLGGYLRRSKALLVELENKSPDGQGPLNLSVERAISRELLEEGRRLSVRPLDAHSTALVADLEPIMICVANGGERMRRADVELIRTGIRQRNLLFKVRMAELAYDPAYIASVMNRTEGR